MKKKLVLIAAAAFSAVLMSGCATQKPLGAEYFNRPREMNVQVTKIPEKAVMRDSGQGGLIGLAVNAGRMSNLREKMAGIQGSTVKELLRQELEKEISKHFTIGESAKDLGLEVEVLTWGWFVPSTVLGIKTGSYQTEIMAKIEVFELTEPKKKKVAFTTLIAQEPIGNKPEETLSKESLVQVIQVMSRLVDEFLVSQKPKATTTTTASK